MCVYCCRGKLLPVQHLQWTGFEPGPVDSSSKTLPVGLALTSRIQIIVGKMFARNWSASMNATLSHNPTPLVYKMNVAEYFTINAF